LQFEHAPEIGVGLDPSIHLMLPMLVELTENERNERSSRRSSMFAARAGFISPSAIKP